MPPLHANLRCIPDNRQFRREIAMLTAEQMEAMSERQADGHRIAWTDVERDGCEITVTLRLCYG